MFLFLLICRLVGMPCADVNTAMVTQLKSLDQYKVAYRSPVVRYRTVVNRLVRNRFYFKIYKYGRICNIVFYDKPRVSCASWHTGNNSM